MTDLFKKEFLLALFLVMPASVISIEESTKATGIGAVIVVAAVAAKKIYNSSRCQTHEEAQEKYEKTVNSIIGTHKAELSKIDEKLAKIQAGKIVLRKILGEEGHCSYAFLTEDLNRLKDYQQSQTVCGYLFLNKDPKKPLLVKEELKLEELAHKLLKDATHCNNKLDAINKRINHEQIGWEVIYDENAGFLPRFRAWLSWI